MLFSKQLTHKRLKAKAKWSCRRASWRHRTLPALVIVGAQKAGTTSLFNYLSQHPQLVQSSVKEVHFFDGGLNPDTDAYANGEAWYRAHFPLKSQLSKNSVPFEASPLYMFSPWAAERMASMIPHVKLVAVLRNPTERAISHFFHEQRKSREPLSLADALSAEERRLAAPLKRGDYKSHEFQHFSYKLRGHYCEQLKRIRNYFPLDQLLVLCSERLFASPATVLRQVYKYAGVDTEFVAEDLRPSNVASNRGAVRQEVYDQLNDYFLPHNQDLYDLLGEDYGW